jgi:hypothetical protein
MGKGTGPFTPVLVDQCVAMKLLRQGGGLMIQAFGYAWTGDIAFHVMNNVYEPDTVLKLRALRPDRSTFLVLDRFDKEVLYVRYLNRNAVRIRGRFLCGEAPQAIIRDDAILVGGIRLNGVFTGQTPGQGPCLRHHQSRRLWNRDQGQVKEACLDYSAAIGPHWPSAVSMLSEAGNRIDTMVPFSTSLSSFTASPVQFHQGAYE